MQILKIIMLIMIVLACMLIGIIISKRYSKRVEELREIRTALNMLETKIKFTYEPLPEIFNQISSNLSQNMGEIFAKASSNMNNMLAKEAWEKALDKNNFNMNQEDINILKKMGGLLGKTDVDGQISEIKLTNSFINTQIKKAEEEKEKNAKMYRTLGTVVGLAIVIILF